MPLLFWPAKPDNKKIATVYVKFPILRIYNAENGDLYKEIRYLNNQPFPYSNISDNQTSERRKEVFLDYWKIKSTNQFIYALYIGRPIDKKERLSNLSNEIHVWDWEGNPVSKILLDKEVFSFDVDPKDQYLIGSAIDKMDKRYKYTLD